MAKKMREINFSKINKISGSLNLPGDKSISHRAIMFSALANGKSVICNLSSSEDVSSTINCFKSLGCSFEKDKDKLIICGKGYKGFVKPAKELNAGNSGTTARLLSGILSAQNFESTLIGDESLSKRPMKRIIEPLSLMGARLYPADNYTLPMKIVPAEKLMPIEYELPVASAQVKSAILLMGLHLDSPVKVLEREPSRNHTEAMLGLEKRITDKGVVIYSSRYNYPEAKEYTIPSDISSAAFFIILTLLSKNSELILKNVSLNETRTGIINILRKMNGRIEISNERIIGGEKLGDIRVSSSSLINIEIPESLIPNIIDEIPILSVAGVFAEGDFIIKNAEELRFKESDRISAVCDNMKLLGINTVETKDGFCLSGTPSKPSPIFDSFDDHRIAMSFAVMSMLLENGGKVKNFDCVRISNPDFTKQISSIVD